MHNHQKLGRGLIRSDSACPGKALFPAPHLGSQEVGRRSAALRRLMKMPFSNNITLPLHFGGAEVRSWRLLGGGLQLAAQLRCLRFLVAATPRPPTARRAASPAAASVEEDPLNLFERCVPVAAAAAP
jgi:hypothetical protein